MAFQVPSNILTCRTKSYVAEKDSISQKKSYRYRRYTSLMLMQNSRRSSVDTHEITTLDRAQFLQLFSLNLLAILGLDKVAPLTETTLVEKKSLGETISEGLSKILTRKEGNQDVSYKKDSNSKSATGLKHAKPLSEDQEETAEALFEKLKSRRQSEPNR
ncbi:hypothetical protein GpartN1_g1121.t1 [Galdieria partita]|uniref:Uncharacterized protein n=1 Tax=Galdieria partita TaxID=83374 RepID=A0A9C7PRT8_9RHOD|nr:hypothetical protein GpartN1_g1121.t1 [Galdieria partita]